MLGEWFYNERIRKSVAVFGSLFNNIFVIRNDSAGNVISQTKVPLSYAPQRDFLARMVATESGENQERQIAIKLPRMSFEILAMNYDPTRQLPKLNKRTVPNITGAENAKLLYTPVPFNITFQLNVYARSQDDALQIVEQILPFFTPQYTVSVKPLDGFDLVEDTPIKLDGMTMQDDYEGAVENRRTIIYTLDFEMKINLYRKTNPSSSMITSAESSLFDMDGNLLTFIQCDANVSSGTTGTGTEDIGTVTNTLVLKNTLNPIVSYSVTTQPSYGTATVDASGKWVYTPNSDFFGSDPFVIGVDVGQNVIESVTITPTIISADGDAVDDVFNWENDGTSLVMDVSANDDFETTGNITHTVQTQPSSGVVTLIDSLAGTFRWTPPDASFTGTVTWEYRAIPTEAQQSAEVAEVTIVVTETSIIDDDFANVTLLLNNVGGQVVDQSNAANTITENGTVLYSSESPGAGFNPSLNVDGSWDITGLYDGDLDGDFTIEFWVNTYADANLNTATFLDVNTTGNVQVKQYNPSWGGVDLATGITIGSAGFPASQDVSTQNWVHVAIVRQGVGTPNIKRFTNGIQDPVNNSAQSLVTFTASDFKIGDTDGEYYLNDLRITKGVARYTGNFTPPTEKFPTS